MKTEAWTASKGVVPANTESTNKWVLKNLEEWMEMRKKGDEPVPDDLLSCCDAHVVDTSHTTVCQFHMFMLSIVCFSHVYARYCMHFCREYQRALLGN